MKELIPADKYGVFADTRDLSLIHILPWAARNGTDGNWLRVGAFANIKTKMQRPRRDVYKRQL